MGRLWKYFLELNLSQTKDVVMYFRKSPPSPRSTFIEAAAAEMARGYKCLGVVLNTQTMF